MENLYTLFSTLLIILFVTIIPGPEFILVMRNTIAYSKKEGFYTGLGISISIGLHALYTLLIVNYIANSSGYYFSVLKYMGSAYFFYIGIRTFFIKVKNQKKDQVSKNKINKFKAIRMGFISNLLNIRVPIFFLGIFTFFLSQNSFVIYNAIIIIVSVIQTSIWFYLVSYFFSEKKLKPLFIKYQKLIIKTAGVLLIFASIRLLFFKI